MTSARAGARRRPFLLHFPLRFLERVKRALFGIQDMAFFTGRTLAAAVTRPFYGRDLYEQMHFAGWGSLHLVLLSSFFAGQALALQLSKELTDMGSKDYIGRLMATSVVRSLGPVLTGLVVAARMGAGNAAEVGAMKISNQIDALIAYGIDPVRKLAVPRLLGLVIMLPVLATLGDAVGILGGYLVSVAFVHVAPETYWAGVWASLQPGDVLVGFVKPFFFAAFIALVGTYKGFHAAGGTKGVGIATTEAVVMCSVGILVSDLLLTRVVFNPLGW